MCNEIIDAAECSGESMDTCRNCGSPLLRELGFIGKIAPFFLKRVFDIEMRVPVSPHPLKELARKIGRPVRRLFSKVFSKEAYLEMQICMTCSFLQVKHLIPEDWIMRLYLDYRSDSYNRERIRYEPSYELIAERVGVEEVEVTNRVKAATDFLIGRLQVGQDFTMLDYGGADGRFLPDIPARKFVYEISDIAPVQGVTRIAEKEELGLYSYVHLAHVLEHVAQPLKLVREVLGRVQPGGYLYVEVPQEIPEAKLSSLRESKPKIELGVHEHINGYSTSAVTKLFEAVGLELVAIQADHMDVGWASAVHLRALGRKHQIAVP